MSSVMLTVLRRYWVIILVAISLLSGMMITHFEQGEVLDLARSLQNPLKPVIVLGLMWCIIIGAGYAYVAYLRASNVLAPVGGPGIQSHVSLKHGRQLPLKLSVLFLVRAARPRTGVPGILAFGLALAVSKWTQGGHYVEPPVSHLLIGAFSSFLPLLCANWMNTWSDVMEDSVNLPHRVREATGIGRALKRVSIASYVLLPLLGLAVSKAFALVVVLGLALMSQYSLPPFLLKRRPIGSLLLFGCVCAVPMLLGFIISPPDNSTWLAWCFWFVMYMWFALFGMAKNIQDYDGDLAAGIRTTATMFRSRREAAIVSALFQCLPFVVWAGFLYIKAFPPQLYLPLGWIIAVLLNGWLTYRWQQETKKLQRLQALYFIYPMGLMVTTLLVLDTSAIAWSILAAGAGVLLFSDMLNWDSRVPRNNPASGQEVVARETAPDGGPATIGAVPAGGLKSGMTASRNTTPVALVLTFTGIVFNVVGNFGHYFRLHVHNHARGFADPTHRLAAAGHPVIIWGALWGLWASRSVKPRTALLSAYTGVLAAFLLSSGFLGFFDRPAEAYHHLLHIFLGLTATVVMVYGNERTFQVFLGAFAAVYGTLAVIGLTLGGMGPNLPLDGRPVIIHTLWALASLGVLAVPRFVKRFGSGLGPLAVTQTEAREQ